MKQRLEIPPSGSYTATLQAFGRNKDGDLVVRMVIDTGKFRWHRVSTVRTGEAADYLERWLSNNSTIGRSRFDINLTTTYTYLSGDGFIEVDELPETEVNAKVRYHFKMAPIQLELVPSEIDITNPKGKFVRTNGTA